MTNVSYEITIQRQTKKKDKTSEIGMVKQYLLVTR